MTIPAHRVLLAAASPFFENVLRDPSVDEISLKGWRFEIVELAMTLIYTGRVNVEPPDLSDFIGIACGMFQVDSYF